MFEFNKVHKKQTFFWYIGKRNTYKNCKFT